MKIGLDVHGVIDTFPFFIAELSRLFVSAGHEVHIVTGLRRKDIEPNLLRLGVKWTHFFSMTDYHESQGTTIFYDEKGNPWMEKGIWEQTKADYAKRVKLDIHLDDSGTYGKYFSTPYMRCTGKSFDKNTPEFRLLSLASDVLYTDKKGPPREGLPGQGTLKYWIMEYLTNGNDLSKEKE